MADGASEDPVELKLCPAVGDASWSEFDGDETEFATEKSTRLVGDWIEITEFSTAIDVGDASSLILFVSVVSKISRFFSFEFVEISAESENFSFSSFDGTAADFGGEFDIE